MTAAVIHLNESTRLRLKIKRATRGLLNRDPTPAFRNLIRADAEQAISELEMETEPDVLLSVGQSHEWTACNQCKREVTPYERCAIDHIKDLVWCMDCWPVSG